MQRFVLKKVKSTRSTPSLQFPPYQVERDLSNPIKHPLTRRGDAMQVGERCNRTDSAGVKQTKKLMHRPRPRVRLASSHSRSTPAVCMHYLRASFKPLLSTFSPSLSAQSATTMSDPRNPFRHDGTVPPSHPPSAVHGPLISFLRPNPDPDTRPSTIE